MSSEELGSGGSPEVVFDSELQKASQLLRQDELEEALEVATGALALRPSHLLAQHLLGLVLFRQRRFAQAHSIFESLVRQSPDVIILRLNAGIAAVCCKNPSAAVEHLQRVVDVDQTQRRAFGYLALAHLQRGEPHLARAALLEAEQGELAQELTEQRSAEENAALASRLEHEIESWPLTASAVLPCEGFSEVMPPPALGAAPSGEPSVPEQPAAQALERSEGADRGDGFGGPSFDLTPSPVERPSTPAHAIGAAERCLEGLMLEGVQGGPAASLARGMLILQLKGEAALVRADQIIAERGSLGWSIVQRRRKGAEQGPFLCQGAPVMEAHGFGTLLVHPGRGQQLQLLELQDESLYLREDLLVACSGLLQRENGHVPGAGDDSPGFVHLRGTGFVAWRVTGQLFTLPVAEGDRLELRLACLAGWTGKTVPQPVRREGALVVGFTGAGVLIVQLASDGGGDRGS